MFVRAAFVVGTTPTLAPTLVLDSEADAWTQRTSVQPYGNELVRIGVVEGREVPEAMLVEVDVTRPARVDVEMREVPLVEELRLVVADLEV